MYVKKEDFSFNVAAVTKRWDESETKFEKTGPFGLPTSAKDDDFFILPNNPYFTALEKIAFYDYVINRLDRCNNFPAIDNYRGELDKILNNYCGGCTAYRNTASYELEIFILNFLD